MNIGIDLDGVIYDTERWYRAYSEKFDFENGGRGERFKGESRAQRRYDWSFEETVTFLKKYCAFIEKNAPMMALAKEVITYLKNKGNKIVLITSRGKPLEEEIELTKIRLAKDEIPFDKLYFAQHNKVDACKKEKIDVMIDDYDEVINNLSNEGIKCLHFRDLQNKPALNKSITEVHNWGEVLRYFEDFIFVEDQKVKEKEIKKNILPKSKIL